MDVSPPPRVTRDYLVCECCRHEVMSRCLDDFDLVRRAGMHLHFRSQGPASWLLDDRRSKQHPCLRTHTRFLVPLRRLLAEGD